MKNENYITLQGWMINELKLSGNELILYALIYGFSQDGKSRFKGSLQYLAETLRIAKRNVIEVIKKLIKKGYIKKYKSGIGRGFKCDYAVNLLKIKKFWGEKSTPQKGDETSPLKDEKGDETSPQRVTKHHQKGDETSPHITTCIDIDNIPSAKAEDRKEIVPVFQEPTQIEPVSRSPAKKRSRELTPEQILLFKAARACFEADGRTKAIMYQDKGSAQMSMENIKLFVVRCSNIAPEMTADFMHNMLEHFKVLVNGKLKGRAEFTPRALITPWIWETVIGSLPEAENELDEKIRASIKGMFQ